MTYIWQYTNSVTFSVILNKGDQKTQPQWTESSEKRKYALEETDRPWE